MGINASIVKENRKIRYHIESRKTGGNSPSNLITLCETCHKEYHKGNIDLKIRRGKSLRDAAVMGIMKWRLYEELKSKYDNISMTFGYVTKYNRINHDIENLMFQMPLLFLRILML